MEILLIAAAGPLFAIFWWLWGTFNPFLIIFPYAQILEDDSVKINIRIWSLSRHDIQIRTIFVRLLSAESEIKMTLRYHKTFSSFILKPLRTAARTGIYWPRDNSQAIDNSCVKAKIGVSIFQQIRGKTLTVWLDRP